MNVTLSVTDASESVTDRITNHQRVMTTAAGHTLTGATVLVSEGSDYPGSYQVWSETDQNTWVYVNTEGEVLETDCPVSNHGWYV